MLCIPPTVNYIVSLDTDPTHFEEDLPALRRFLTTIHLSHQLGPSTSRTVGLRRNRIVPTSG